jgi:hypothetical protein
MSELCHPDSYAVNISQVCCIGSNNVWCTLNALALQGPWFAMYFQVVNATVEQLCHNCRASCNLC